ncbi:MAG: hypothetical protein HY815_16690 [Candidatus Riflebacteria bacterium]|nr:hypothetical protein [Candidatus Riflebacteria bacterium]
MSTNTPPPARGGIALPRKIRPLLLLLGALVLLVAALFFHVRGEPIGSAPPSADRAIERMASGLPGIASPSDLMAVGDVAAALTREAGLAPGPFRLHFLPGLDLLEKFHHLAHGPFTGIRRMYCDIWINSLTTYGRPERTWGFGPVDVRASLKLPPLILLLDRLGRQKSARAEYTEAVFEAFRGMEVHEVAGRSRIWLRLVAASVRHPLLALFVREQLGHYDLAWSDSAEVRMWWELEADPRLERLRELAAGGPGGPMRGGGPPGFDAPRQRPEGETAPLAWARCFERIVGELSGQQRRPATRFRVGLDRR